MQWRPGGRGRRRCLSAEREVPVLVLVLVPSCTSRASPSHPLSLARASFPPARLNLISCLEKGLPGSRVSSRRVANGGGVLGWGGAWRSPTAEISSPPRAPLGPCFHRKSSSGKALRSTPFFSRLGTGLPRSVLRSSGPDRRVGSVRSGAFSWSSSRLGCTREEEDLPTRRPSRWKALSHILIRKMRLDAQRSNGGGASRGRGGASYGVFIDSLAPRTRPPAQCGGSGARAGRKWRPPRRPSLQ